MATVNYDNLTTTVAAVIEEDEGVPVYGLPGYRFYLIHITGLVSLVTSLSFSTSLLVYLVVLTKKSVATRPIGERLVIYLASFDWMYSVCHIMDHSYMLAVSAHVPREACTYFGFNLNQFVLGQALIVIFTSVNAFVMVVKERKIDLGKHDWKLMLYALGIPCLVGIVGASTGHFGTNGVWCYVYMGNTLGPILTNLVGAVMITTFTFNLICYGAVYFKIRQVAQKMAASSGGKGGGKYHKTAKVMMLFVAVYMGQWWAYIVFAIASLVVNPPHVAIMWASVFFSNLGGMFNFIAFTFVRKKQQSVSEAPPVSSDKSHVARVRGNMNPEKTQLKPAMETTSTNA